MGDHSPPQTCSMEVSRLQTAMRTQQRWADSECLMIAFASWYKAIHGSEVDHDGKVWAAAHEDAMEQIMGSSKPSRPDMLSQLPWALMQRLLKHRGYEVASVGEPDLGKGTYGCVVRIRRSRDSRVFAMKRQLLGFTPVCTESALRELGILNAAMGCRGLLQMEDAFLEHAGLCEVCPCSGSAELWTVLEYFPHDLHAVKRSFCAERPARHIIFQVLRGLHALHSADIVHRDLKPSNVLVDMGRSPPYSACVSICDFGMARSIGRMDAALPMDTTMWPQKPRRRRPVSTNVVTCPWRAPELWGWADVNRMSKRDMKSIDVFALALLWAELLGERRVIASDDTDPPKMRLLEILCRVDAPSDATLQELGFAEDVVQFVGLVSVGNIAGLKQSIFDSGRARASRWHKEYISYLFRGQSYRGIRAWVLKHSPLLSKSSLALPLLEAASSFDYRTRPSVVEILDESYFVDQRRDELNSPEGPGTSCRRLADVGDALEGELQLQAGARRSQAVEVACRSVKRVADLVRSELAKTKSKASSSLLPIVHEIL